MSNLSDTNLIQTLDYISIQINRYFSIFILLFGTIGNILNCLVLFQSCLRSNPCAFLFLISSIANIICIISGLTTRILSSWNMDLTNEISWICKFRAFLILVSRTTAFWLIAFATIDRWCLSHRNRQLRQISSLRNAQQITISLIILSISLYCQVIYCYDINIILAPLRCYSKTIICRILTDITYACFTTLFPILIMFIFGLMTISNIQQTYSNKLSKTDLHRMLKLTNDQRQKRKRIDRYLYHMLFIQIILLIVLTIPQVIERSYTTLTMNKTKSLLQIQIDKFIYNFVILLTYLASGMPFYIYTLTGGSLFRNAFLSLSKQNNV
jgi:hypothetical protein